jgi:hypothetical protein
MSGFETVSEERLFQSVGVVNLLTPSRYVPGRFLKTGRDNCFVHPFVLIHRCFTAPSTASTEVKYEGCV